MKKLNTACKEYIQCAKILMMQLRISLMFVLEQQGSECFSSKFMEPRKAQIEENW